MENQSHSDGAKNLLDVAKFSRRSFLALSASMTSCAVAEPLMPVSTGQVKTTSNTGYRTPTIADAASPLKSNFSKNAGITFTRVQCPGNFIAITFDDGPHPENTPRLLDIMRARNIKGTFYVIGNNVNLYPQVLRRTVAEGHEIGNHTQTHRLLSKLSNDQVRKELSNCRDAIGRAAGVQPRTMRPPYGGLRQDQREIVHAEFGYPTILWSVDPLDWKRPGASVVTSRILAGTTAGGIVLAHDLHAQTIDAMPATLDGLLRRGFQFVTVSQLLAMQTAAPSKS